MLKRLTQVYAIALIGSALTVGALIACTFIGYQLRGEVLQIHDTPVHIEMLLYCFIVMAVSVPAFALLVLSITRRNLRRSALLLCAATPLAALASLIEPSAGNWATVGTVVILSVYIMLRWPIIWSPFQRSGL